MNDAPHEDTERNFGPQPLDAILAEHSLDNHDIVAACEEHLTHKAVQRARKGRRLTKHMQRRVLAALNKAVALQGNEGKREWKVSELFNY